MAEIACCADKKGARTNRPKLSKRVYLHLVHGQPAPFALVRWSLAERFHWTLDEVDALTLTDLAELYSVEDGRGKAHEEKKGIADHISKMRKR